MSQANLTSEPQTQRHSQVWYRPTFSPDHGVYVVLFVSFLTGAAAAQSWTIATTLALVCAFCGFQAEHPIALQIKQRRSWKPRFLFWGGFYSLIALAIALHLWLGQAQLKSPILAVFAGAIAAFAVDALSVLFRKQKSIWNEFITFAAVCLSALFAFAATTGTLSEAAIGLWLLNTLFFASTIFTVKFRKDKVHAVSPGLIYHAIAPVLLAGVGLLNWLTPFTLPAFAVALLKYCLILWQWNWYFTAKIQFVAMLETSAAIVFGAIVCLTLLPARLPL